MEAILGSTMPSLGYYILVLARYNCTYFFQPFPSTIEDIYVSNVDNDRGTTETIRIYDTAGIEPKSPTLKEDLPKHLFPFADGYLLVFGLDDEASFQGIAVACIIFLMFFKHFHCVLIFDTLLFF